MKDQLFNLCGFKASQQWDLLYRGSRDGFRASDFHSKCDTISKTLTIIKAANSGNIFGGYTETEWNQSGQFKYDKNAFLFSLVNMEQRPVKVDIANGQENNAMGSSSNQGPVFGNGNDINISDNSNLPNANYSNFGKFYNLPDYTYGSEKAQRFLAGFYKFSVEDIEVFKKE